MAAEIINSFDPKVTAPLDSRLKVADQTARLALKYYFKGFITNQADTNQRFMYIGDGTTNLSSDWEVVQRLITATGVPANTLGVIGDIYINETTKIVYKKTGSSTWTVLFTITGAQIYTGTGAPSNSDGLDGDMYFRSDGGVYRKESGAWSLKFNIKGADGVDGDIYAATSSTSINLSTAAAPLSLTISAGRAYTVGQDVVVASRADNANQVVGTVVSYDKITGAMVLNSLTIGGTGTFTDWDVNINGAPGATGQQGKAFVHTESDINLTQTKITTVQGGTWTPINPWSASVLNDTRSPSELTATAGITGNKAGHSISYNGTSWSDNGTWRGPTGATGPAGTNGVDGANTITNYLPFEYVSSATLNTRTRSLIVCIVPGAIFTLGGKVDIGTILIVGSRNASVGFSTDANATVMSTGDFNQIAPNTSNAFTFGTGQKFVRITLVCVARTGDACTWEVLSLDKQYIYRSLTVGHGGNPDLRTKQIAPDLVSSRPAKIYSTYSVAWVNPANTYEESGKFYARIQFGFMVSRGTVTDTSAFSAYLESDTGQSGIWTIMTTTEQFYTVGDEYQYFTFSHDDLSVPNQTTDTRRDYRLVLVSRGNNTAFAINVSVQVKAEIMVLRK